MRVIVTGGCGFIGSAVVRRLIAQGDQVLNLDKLTYAGNPENVRSIEGSPHYSFAQADICDPKETRRLISEFQPDGIVHLAAESHVDRSIDGPADFIHTNILGTFHLLEACRDYLGRSTAKRELFRFVHVSTDEVYGSLGPTGLFTESSPYQPNSPYSASKASSDLLSRAWFETFNIPIIITNCSNNYGPYHFPEKLIPLMILNALEIKKLPVYGDGSNVRDWLHVEDHARGLELVLKSGRPGETYNIGGNNERTNLQVVETICDILDEIMPDQKVEIRRSLISFVQDRPGHDQRYAIDSSKIRKELQWQPIHTFETGIRHTIEWYLEHRNTWVQNVLSGEYKMERLGKAD